MDGRIDGIGGLLFGWALLQPRIGLLPGMAISAWERGSLAWPSPQRRRNGWPSGLATQEPLR